MRRQFDAQRGFTWVDPTLTHSDVRAETQRRFEAQQNDQLKALMLQVARLSEAAKFELDPAFAAALEARSHLMADHAARKAQAEPDEGAGTQTVSAS